MDVLSELPKVIGKGKKRKGRGLASGRGSKSGRGTTRHQKARTTIPLHFEGGQGKITKKYPLLRGKGRNKAVSPRPLIVKLSDLNVFKAGEQIDIKKLIDNKVVEKKAYLVGVKLLAMGELKKRVKIMFSASKKAKDIVESLGGEVLLR